jgi:hypothetical protein
MKVTGLLVAGFWTLILFASAAQAHLQPSPKDGPNPRNATILDRLPSRLEFWIATPVDATRFGVGGAKSSQVPGVVLGVLGAVTNNLTVNSTNARRAASAGEAMTSDPVALLRELRRPATASGQVDSSSESYELVPAGLLWFLDDTTFRVACALTAYLPDDKHRRWRGRYIVTLPEQFTISEPGAMARANKTFSTCLAEANRLFEGHVTSSLAFTTEERGVRFYNWNSRAPIAEPENSGRVILGDDLGVVELPRDMVEFRD